MIEHFNFFNSNIFTEEYLKSHISKEDFNNYKYIVNNNLDFNEKLASIIAKVMKKWAIEKGATHYAQWFQPLSGFTAEKQTSFLSIDNKNNPIMELSTLSLITGEIDASSFPNGGLRSTFEARGFTKWDYSYPAFIKEISNCNVLCIPTVFYSIDGTSLDKRTPLLNSAKALNLEILRLLRLFGDNTNTEAYSAIGIEQEYFLIKEELYKKRKDLLLTGKTLFGKELIGTTKVHYMGSITENVSNYMNLVEKELWKLGVPAQVRHNEVAPRQYELVPHYEDLKLAANHDFLTMEVLEKQASKFGEVCLLDEKPFKGINGSGKHNNWSINTKEGKQLFSYGTTPIEHARFITMIIALISALDKHSNLIRATVAANNNDRRLSGFEAPSSIVSIYLGKELTQVFEDLVNDKDNNIKLGLSLLNLSQINITDRNRTSPFAFLGNRFEFRMPGASSSVAVCNTVLNTIMAESLSEISKKLENSNHFYKDLKELIIELYKKHSKIIYNGNSYSDEWKEIAKKRGLKDIKKAPEAFKSFITEESIKMFSKYKVYSEIELHSRYKIKLEKYIKNTIKESTVMLDIAKQDIIPQVLKYINFINETINNIKNIDFLENQLKEIIQLLNNLNKQIEQLSIQLSTLDSICLIEKKAEYCSDKIKEEMLELRKIVDTLEGILPHEYWPMPTYFDLLN